jgi:hypothetical protein
MIADCGDMPRNDAASLAWFNRVFPLENALAQYPARDARTALVQADLLIESLEELLWYLEPTETYEHEMAGRVRGLARALRSFAGGLAGAQPT